MIKYVKKWKENFTDFQIRYTLENLRTFERQQ